MKEIIGILQHYLYMASSKDHQFIFPSMDECDCQNTQYFVAS